MLLRRTHQPAILYKPYNPWFLSAEKPRHCFPTARFAQGHEERKDFKTGAVGWPLALRSSAVQKNTAAAPDGRPPLHLLPPVKCLRESPFPLFTRKEISCDRELAGMRQFGVSGGIQNLHANDIARGVVVENNIRTGLIAFSNLPITEQNPQDINFSVVINLHVKLPNTSLLCLSYRR